MHIVPRLGHHLYVDTNQLPLTTAILSLDREADSQVQGSMAQVILHWPGTPELDSLLTYLPALVDVIQQVRLVLDAVAQQMLVLL